MEDFENYDKVVDFITLTINNNKELLQDIAYRIWEKPELAFKEVFAHDSLTEIFDTFGFNVKRNYVLPTGFRAEYNSGNGPTVAILCEYDALPDIGHGCGHNLIAEIGVAVGLIVKSVLDKFPDIKGKLVILGTPAEEGGGGKIDMVRAGAFIDVDVAMMAHPDIVNKTSPLMLTINRVNVTYVATNSHEETGLNSLDAAVACYNQISLLRRNLNENCRIMGIIKGSEIDERNIPIKTTLCFHIRAPSSGMLCALKKKVELCFVSAAEISDCKMYLEYNDGRCYQNLIPNKILTDTFKSHAEEVGIVFEKDKGFLSTAVAVSSDVGNVSHVVPCMQPIFAIGSNYAIHSRDFALLAGSPDAQDGTLAAAKSLALTCLNIFCSPNCLKKIKEEFKVQLQKDELNN